MFLKSKPEGLLPFGFWFRSAETRQSLAAWQQTLDLEPVWSCQRTPWRSQGLQTGSRHAVCFLSQTCRHRACKYRTLPTPWSHQSIVPQYFERFCRRQGYWFPVPWYAGHWDQCTVWIFQVFPSFWRPRFFCFFCGISQPHLYYTISLFPCQRFFENFQNYFRFTYSDQTYFYIRKNEDRKNLILKY